MPCCSVILLCPYFNYISKQILFLVVNFILVSYWFTLVFVLVWFSVLEFQSMKIQRTERIFLTILNYMQTFSFFIFPSRFISAQTHFYSMLVRCMKHLAAKVCLQMLCLARATPDLSFLTSYTLFLLLPFPFAQHPPSQFHLSFLSSLITLFCKVKSFAAVKSFAKKS